MEQLFYSNNHPNENLMLEYADRIMHFLGYSSKEMSLTDAYLECGTLKGQDIPLYPSVVKALGLENYEKKFYPNRYLLRDIPLSFGEYIDLYIENYKK